MENVPGGEPDLWPQDGARLAYGLLAGGHVRLGHAQAEIPLDRLANRAGQSQRRARRVRLVVQQLGGGQQLPAGRETDGAGGVHIEHEALLACEGHW